MRAADGTLLGTGPFRIAKWDLGKSATLAANDQYWGGRPYLDSIGLQMGRTLAEQANDFQINKSEVVEIPLRDLRSAKQRATLTSETPPMETLALVFENGRVLPNVRRALALSIDRAAIHNVLLQKQGETSAALLPRWLSGYAFLFPAERDVAKAKQMAPSVAPLSFVYDRDDPMIRPIGERIAINAMEAGITLRPGSGAADVRLIRLPITSGDPWLALQDLASVLKLAPPATTAGAYEAEKAMLDTSGLIPLFHLPRGWLLRSRVHNWPRFEDVWLDSGAVP
jgi:ABC-type oligopeptide transport system substrate-binding subunit